MLPPFIFTAFARLPGQPSTHLQLLLLASFGLFALPAQTGWPLLDATRTLCVSALAGLAWHSWRWQSQQEVVTLAEFLLARTICAGLQGGLVAYGLMVWLDYLARGIVPDDLNGPLAVLLPLFSYQCGRNLWLIWPRLTQLSHWHQRQRLQLSRL